MTTSNLSVKASLRFGILAIGANGDKNGANGDQLAPMVMEKMAPMAYPITIGANDDHHWRQ